MRKIGLPLLLLLITFSVSAQSKWDTEVRASILATSLWDGDNSGSNPEFKLGANEIYGLGSNFSLLTGLSVYNNRIKQSDSGVTTDAKSFYLQVPANVRYTFPLKSNGALNRAISFEMGPYVACGFAGKTTLSTNGASIQYNTFGNNHFHHLQAGLNTAILLHYNHLEIGAEGQLGLTELGFYGTSVKSIAGGVSLGYQF